MDTRQHFDYSPAHTAVRLEFNEDGKAFTVGSDNGFRVHDVSTGKLIHNKGNQHPRDLISILTYCRSGWLDLICIRALLDEICSFDRRWASTTVLAQQICSLGHADHVRAV